MLLLIATNALCRAGSPTDENWYNSNQFNRAMMIYIIWELGPNTLSLKQSDQEKLVKENKQTQKPL